MYKYKNTTTSNIYIYKNNQRTTISPNEIIFLDYQYEYPGLELLTIVEPIVYNPNAEEDKLETTYVNYKTYNANNELFQTQLNSKVDTSVNTISDLKALTQSYDIINVLGYNSKGDGAGGIFVWVEGSTDSDNGGTIIAPTDINLTGRWYRQYSGILHAKWFGVTTNGNDCTSQIQSAIDSVSGGIIELPQGQICISAPIKLKRGIWLKGVGTFDSALKSGTELYLLSGSNCSMIQTPSAWDSSPGDHSTHFMGLTDMVINGNYNGQGNIEHECVQYWGAFIGSFIKNVHIANSMGPALTFDKGTDLQVDHVWVLKTVCASGYAIDTNMSIRNTGLYAGLLNFNHIYCEHTVTQKNATLFTDPTVRGKGIRLHRVIAANMNDTRFEGMVNGFAIESCLEVRIGLVHSNFNGNALVSDQACILIVDNGTKRISIDTLQCATCDTGFHFVKKATGFFSQFFPDVPVTENIGSSCFGPYRTMNNPGAEYGIFAPFYVTNFGGITQGDLNSPITEISWKFKWDTTQNGFVKMHNYGNSLSVGSSYSQPNAIEKNFLTLNSYGDGTDNIKFNVPVTLFTSITGTNIPQGSIYRFNTESLDAPAYQAVSNLRSGVRFIPTITREPKNPDRGSLYPGEIWINDSVSPQGIFIADNVGTSGADWSQFNVRSNILNKTPDRNARFVGEQWLDYSVSPHTYYISTHTNSTVPLDDWLPLGPTAVAISGAPNRSSRFLGEIWVDTSVIPFGTYISTAVGGGTTDWCPSKAIGNNQNKAPDRHARYIGEIWSDYSVYGRRVYMAKTTDSITPSADWAMIYPTCQNNNGPPDRGSNFIGELWNDYSSSPHKIFMGTATGGTSADFIRLATV